MNFLRDFTRDLLEDTKSTASYGCLMLDLSEALSWFWPKLQSHIKDTDVYIPEGREDKPHVTVLYGFLPEADLEQIQAIVKKFGPIEFTVTGVSLFDSAPEYDVLIYTVESEKLVQLNKALAGLPISPSKHSYNPHSTLAYLNKGTGQKYLKTFTPVTFSCMDYRFSPADDSEETRFSC